MKNYKKVIISTVALLVTFPLPAQEKKWQYESNFDLPGSRAEVYKIIGDVQLKIYIYEPQRHKAIRKRPAIVFFLVGVGMEAHLNSFRNTVVISPRRV